MDLVSRLKLFLNQNGIANSQFADTCGIPRPSLSQLLNGRNKKVSDELISKVHIAYPTLNIMWLMFGDGDMYVGNNPDNNQFNAQPAENLKFSENLELFAENSNPKKSISFGDNENLEAADTNSSINLAARAIQASMMQNSQKRNQSAASQKSSQNSSARKVVNIMVFYSDNSFESFGPTGM